MSRRTSSSAILALVASLALAVPAMAKEGAEARLDTTLPRDAQPGSSIDVGWSVVSIDGEVASPISGSPVYIRLVGPDGTSATEVMGKETPAGSGHYTAQIQVPDGGIGAVIVGMIGEACSDGGGCQRSDMIFPLTDDPLVSGWAPGTAPDAPAAPTGVGLVPFIAIGVAFAVAGGLGALILRRRRMLEAPAGR